MVKAKPISKNPLTSMPKAADIPKIRIPRGPTIRWDIDYSKIFKNRRKNERNNN